MWKIIVAQGRPQMTTRILTAYWVPKATNKHLEYVILIAFPLRQLLQERASMLHYTYCLVYILPTPCTVFLWMLQQRDYFPV
jgi:hypothetical protein